MPSSLDFQHTHLKVRLDRLRQVLRDVGVDGFIVPMADEYQNEYVPPSAQRLAFLSGFTGSAGSLVVLENLAAFFTDGRYTIQARQQIDGALFQIYDIADKTPVGWIVEAAEKGRKIGLDPWLHTAFSFEKIKAAFDQARLVLVPVAQNPVDKIWEERPPRESAPIFAHDMIYAGQSSADKRRKIARDLSDKKRDAVVLSDPSSLAWLLNVRGGDVPHVPLPLSFGILHADESLDWFVAEKKVTHGLSVHLGSCVRVRKPEDFIGALRELGVGRKTVQIDPQETAYAIVACLREAGAVLVEDEDPCLLPKACKNNVELDGMRTAHRRDGAALAKLLAWLDGVMESNPPTELEVEAQLETFRRMNSLYRGSSFATIAGSGPNGAIVHYRATEDSNRRLEAGSFLLLDSGGQYMDGTTDVTRTIPLVGLQKFPAKTTLLSREMMDRYTRVLKGHIALASIRFPAGTTGAELDVLARQYLWEIGCDYAHGTGHGVGCYLSVHEGPQSLSRRSSVALKAGMVLSNEPGFYKEGAYGIRHENLMAVVELPEFSTKTRQMLGFEVLTLAPFDRRGLILDLLTQSERAWLNEYHARVFRTLLPQLDEKSTQWLKLATEAV